MTTFKSLASDTGRQIGHLCTDESGATAIEYAMIAAGVGACVAQRRHEYGLQAQDRVLRQARRTVAVALEQIAVESTRLNIRSFPRKRESRGRVLQLPCLQPWVPAFAGDERRNLDSIAAKYI